MPELPRDLPHLYLRGSGKPEPYTSKMPPPRYKLPQRERVPHAEAVRAALTAALAAVGTRRVERDPAFLTGTPGFYLDFEIPAESEIAAELLENRRKHIELVAFRQPVLDEPAVATVFVPNEAANHFLKKVDQYRDEVTPAGKPKNEALMSRIDNVALAALRSVYTDDPALFPAAGDAVWWEAWLRQGHIEAFDADARRLALPVQLHRLVFPDREVRLVYADSMTIGRLFLNSDSIAEVRRARDTPSLFACWSNVEQAAWALDLADRLVLPDEPKVAICVLDTGVTQAHPLIAPALDPNDIHAYDPTWPGGDKHGHGTNMAGTALYGDLMPLLEANGPVSLTHCLESVKVLPDNGENEPKLYGAITGESIARAEITAPNRRRAVCLAVTSDIGTSRGHPSSWSAAIDQLCFGDETTSRLILVSAGNIRDHLSKAQYPFRK